MTANLIFSHVLLLNIISIFFCNYGVVIIHIWFNKHILNLRMSWIILISMNLWVEKSLNEIQLPLKFFKIQFIFHLLFN